MTHIALSTPRVPHAVNATRTERQRIIKLTVVISLSEVLLTIIYTRTIPAVSDNRYYFSRQGAVYLHLAPYTSVFYTLVVSLSCNAGAQASVM